MAYKEDVEFIKRLLEIQQEVQQDFINACGTMRAKMNQLIARQLDGVLEPGLRKKIVLTDPCKQECEESKEEIPCYTAVDVNLHNSTNSLEHQKQVRLKKTLDEYLRPNVLSGNRPEIQTYPAEGDKNVTIRARSSRAQESSIPKKIDFKTSAHTDSFCLSPDASSQVTSKSALNLMPRNQKHIQQIKPRAIALYQAGVAPNVIGKLLDISDNWIFHVWGNYTQFPIKYARKMRNIKKKCQNLYSECADIQIVSQTLGVKPLKVKYHLDILPIFKDFLTLEYRLEACQAVIYGQSLSKVSELYDIPEKTLKSWVVEYKEKKTVKMTSFDNIVGEGEYNGLIIRKTVEMYLLTKDLNLAAAKFNVQSCDTVQRWVNLFTDSDKSKPEKQFYNYFENSQSKYKDLSEDVLIIPSPSMNLAQLIDDEYKYGQELPLRPIPSEVSNRTLH